MNDSPLTGESAGRGMLIAALISGCGLMYPLVNAGPLVLDEHGSYWIAGPENPGTLLGRSLGYAAIPPLSGWLQQMFLVTFGKSEFVFRASSGACYLAAIFVTYLLGKELVGTLGGGTAALLIAWHPSVLDEVRMARCYGLVLLLAALAFWATVCWRKRPEQRRWILVWAAANAGLVWTHYVTLPLIPLQLLVLAGLLPLSSQRQRPIWSQLIVAVLLLVLLLLPLWPSFFRMWEFRELLNYNKEGVAVWKIIGPIWWLGLPAGWAAGALVSLFVATRPSTSRLPANFWTLLAWGLLPVCLVTVFSRGNLTSLSNPRYCLPYAVPAACLLASCLTFRRGAWASAAAVIVTLAAAWLMNDLAPWQMRRLGDRSAADWHEMAQQLERDGRAGEPVFVLAGLIESSMVPAEPFRRDDLFMDYVSCRLGRFYVQTHHPRYGLPLLWHAEWKLQEFYKDVLQTHCDADAETVWVAVATDTDLNRTSLARFQELLVSQGYIESATHQWSSAVLIRYLCPSAASTRR